MLDQFIASLRPQANDSTSLLPDILPSIMKLLLLSLVSLFLLARGEGYVFLAVCFLLEQATRSCSMTPTTTSSFLTILAMTRPRALLS